MGCCVFLHLHFFCLLCNAYCIASLRSAFSPVPTDITCLWSLSPLELLFPVHSLCCCSCWIPAAQTLWRALPPFCHLPLRRIAMGSEQAVWSLCLVSHCKWKAATRKLPINWTVDVSGRFPVSHFPSHLKGCRFKNGKGQSGQPWKLRL